MRNCIAIGYRFALLVDDWGKNWLAGAPAAVCGAAMLYWRYSAFRHSGNAFAASAGKTAKAILTASRTRH